MWFRDNKEGYDALINETKAQADFYLAQYEDTKDKEYLDKYYEYKDNYKQYRWESSQLNK